MRCASGSRQYVTASPHHSIYISLSTNPYFNLTFEDWLFRHKAPEEPLLLIYRDVPCIVIGRNQNPWKEVNFQALRATPGIPVIRRRSGGGTVYHDLGNTNFSIHLPRHSFDRKKTAQVILRAVRSLSIDGHINERNDICVGKEKVSGSAYKIVSKRAYHHGTMLISSRLDMLGDLLRCNKETMVTRGVASVRSPVCNLQDLDQSLDHDIFASAVVNEFKKEYDIHAPVHYIPDEKYLTSIDYIRKGMEELSTWDWLYGQTPEFTYTINRSFSWGEVNAEIRSKHGIISSCIFNISNTHLGSTTIHELVNLGKFFEKKRYSVIDDFPALSGSSGPGADILEWMQEVTIV